MWWHYRLVFRMQSTLSQIPNQKSTKTKFFFITKNLFPFLNSKYKYISSSKIVREMSLLLNNLVSQRSFMPNLGLRELSF